MNARLIVFILLSATNTAAAQSIGADFFPLALGNEWTYRYLAIDDNIFNQSAVGDSGRASYLIVSKEATPDSIVWGLRESRDIVRTSYSYWREITIFSRVQIKDTVFFSIAEYLNGNHRIVRPGNAEDDWRSVFCMVAQTSDTTRIFRYVPDAEADTAQFSTGWRRWGTSTSPPTFAVRWVLQRGTGIRSVEYSTPGLTGGAYRTYHKLERQTILSAAPTVTAQAPNELSIESNYPNPFNSSTTLSFSVGSSERVTLTIVDILGRQIADLLDDTVGPGKHLVVWNASSQSSGTYFGVVKTSRLVNYVRLLLLK